MDRIRALILEAHRRSLWQVLGIYVFGAWAVYQIIAEITDRLGMPAWVPGLAIVLFLVGLPIVLATAFVQEGLPGQTPQQPDAGPADRTLVPGLEDATPVERRSAPPLLTPARPHFFLTWQRSVLAGITAFLLLGLTAGGYMGLREAGVGPFASLLSGGTLNERDRIIVAQFGHAAGDSVTADALTEALRVDLAQSHVLAIAEQRFVGDALQRMDRPRDTRLTPQLAREVAIREGAKAVLAGEIVPAGSGFIIAARLVHAATDEVLLSRRENVAGVDDMIAAIDRLSKKLRADIGESLRTVRADPPLEAVTTRSLVALQKYTQGARALDLDRDYDRAIALLREAVEADSLFAMAWRKLAVAYYNTQFGADQLLPATTRAYELRDRLTERERYHMIAFYNLNVTRDSRAAATAYRSLLELYPDDHAALNNIALSYSRLREDELATEYYRRAIAVDSFSASSWTNLVQIEYRLGRREEARRLLADATLRFPDHRDNRAFRAALEQAEGNHAEAERIMRELVEDSRGSEIWRSRANLSLSSLLLLQGRVAESLRHLSESTAANRALGVGEADVWEQRWLADLAGWVQGRPAEAVRRAEAMMASDAWRRLSPVSRGYLETASLLARNGRPDRGRAVLDEWRTLPGARDVDLPWRETETEGWIALAENRPADAVASFRSARAVSGCSICGIVPLALAFEAAGAVDSAAVYYRQYIDTPYMTRIIDDAWELPVVYERLAALYQQQGELASARHYARLFTELWQRADPELQPRVRRMNDLLSRTVEQ